MPGVFNLTTVLQFIIDGFYDKSFAKKDSLPHTHQLVLHVAFDSCYQMYSFVPRCVEQSLRNVPLVGEQVTEQFAAQHIKHFRIPVTHIAFCQAEVQQLATVISDKMKFKTIEPTHCALAYLCHAFEHSICPDALVVAASNLGGIHEADSGTRTKTYQTDEHQ